MTAVAALRLRIFSAGLSSKIPLTSRAYRIRWLSVSRSLLNVRAEITPDRWTFQFSIVWSVIERTDRPLKNGARPLRLTTRRRYVDSFTSERIDSSHILTSSSKRRFRSSVPCNRSAFSRSSDKRRRARSRSVVLSERFICLPRTANHAK